MKVSEIMTKNPSYCLPSDSAYKAASIMRDKDVGIVPIVESTENPKLAGVVTDRDLCMFVVAEGRDPRNVRIHEAMTKKPVHCRPEDNISECLETMRVNQIRRMLVVDSQSNLVGIVAMADLARNPAVHVARLHHTLSAVCRPTGKPSKPRAESYRPAA